MPVPFEEWWAVLENRRHPEEAGLFVHPVSDPAVIAGNGTIELEIMDDLPEVSVTVVPYGGGGPSCGIASAMRARRPQVRTCAYEVETSAPFSAVLNAGAATPIERTPTFVDGIAVLE